jgi:putative ABC transport system permease protein
MFVALLAVAIGATVLSGLVTIYLDIPNQMGKEFRSYGANLILLPDEDTTIPETSIDKAKSLIDSDELVGITPYIYDTIKINEQPFMAAGTDLAQAKKTSPYWYVTGDWPTEPGDALIGKEISSTIRIVPGDRFTITGTDTVGDSFTKELRVKGVLETGGSEEAYVFMSDDDMVDAIGGVKSYDVVECSISASGDRLSEIADAIESGVTGLLPKVVQKVTKSEGTVLLKLQALIYLVTLVVLVLTMICVATTMMAVVTERRKEIGLRKALGASNSSISLEFFGEAIFVGLLGGLLGIVLGYFFAQLIAENVFDRSISMRLLLVPATLIVSVVVTSIACIIPVRSATDVDPAIVLKGE